MNTVMQRVSVSLIFIPIIILVMLNAGVPLLVLLSLIALAATYEFRSILSKKYPRIPLIVVPLNVVYLIVFSLSICRAVWIFPFSIIIIAGYEIFSNRIDGALSKTALALFAVVYISYFLSLAYHISSLSGGNYLLITIIVAIWTTDTFAYFCGMLLGKHRNIFKVSPKKSLEGYFSGIIGAALSSYLLYRLFQGSFTLLQAALIAVSAGIFGQFGDLIESMIKRDVGVKDSSNIIPGHGGVLDRFDSFLIAVPAFYLLNMLITCL